MCKKEWKGEKVGREMGREGEVRERKGGEGGEKVRGRWVGWREDKGGEGGSRRKVKSEGMWRWREERRGGGRLKIHLTRTIWRFQPSVSLGVTGSYSFVSDPSYVFTLRSTSLHPTVVGPLHSFNRYFVPSETVPFSPEFVLSFGQCTLLLYPIIGMRSPN